MMWEPIRDKPASARSPLSMGKKETTASTSKAKGPFC